MKNRKLKKYSGMPVVGDIKQNIRKEELSVNQSKNDILYIEHSF